MYKTTICTPVDTTTLLSCISTPNSKSKDKGNFLKKLRSHNADQIKIQKKENLISTEEERRSEDSIRIKFSLNSKIKFEKNFNFCDSMETVKKQILK